MGSRAELVATGLEMGENDASMKKDGRAAPSVAPCRDELIRAKAGDHNAFERLMRRHERRVFNTARRILGHVGDAEDITQDVFVILFENLDQLDPERPLAAWLYRVTVNCCLKLKRRKWFRRMLSLNALTIDREPRSMGSNSDPSARAICNEETRIAEQALAALPYKERTALVLRDLQGLSTREVARILDTAETTVRSQISRARLKLRAYRARKSTRSPS